MILTTDTSKNIRKWLANNGFSCSCRICGSYYYMPDSDYIAIPRKASIVEEYDFDFMKCLRDLGLAVDFDITTLSILHELGHFMTYPQFTEEEWENDNIYKNVLTNTESEQTELNWKYWGTITELAANQWAVHFANENIEIVQSLEDIIETTSK